MKLRLQERPVEWIKFTGVIAFMAGLIACVLFRRRVLGLNGLVAVTALLSGIVIVSALRPSWFRGFYRVGMTVSWHVGQIMGRILLMLFFLLVVTPMGLFLRLCGKDLLALRRSRTASYWRASRPSSPFDRLF
jgi:hypothetical protein